MAVVSVQPAAIESWSLDFPPAPSRKGGFLAELSPCRPHSRPKISRKITEAMRFVFGWTTRLEPTSLPVVMSGLPRSAHLKANSIGALAFVGAKITSSHESKAPVPLDTVTGCKSVLQQRGLSKCCSRKTLLWNDADNPSNATLCIFSI